MSRRGIHVCLLSEQPLGNLIPVLMDDPALLVLFETDAMRARGAAARMVEALALRHGMHEPTVVERLPLPEGGYAVLKTAVAEAFAALADAHPGEPLVLNVTGGTKLMAMADFAGAVAATRRHAPGLKVIYTDSDHGCIEVLHPQPRREPLRAVLDLATALCAAGVAVEPGHATTVPPLPAAIAAACARKVQNFHFRTVLARLNGVAANRRVEGTPLRLAVGQALNTGRAVPPSWLALSRIDLSARPDLRAPERRRSVDISDEEAFAIQSLVDLGALCVDGEGWRFASPEMLLFITGDWLEVFVHQAALRVFGTAWRNLRVLRGQPASARGAKARGLAVNELDVLALCGNTLLLFECKSAISAAIHNEAVYKLDALGRPLVGARGELLLVSAFPFNPASRQRAAEAGQHLVECDTLFDLEATLRTLHQRHHLG